MLCPFRKNKGQVFAYLANMPQWWAWSWCLWRDVGASRQWSPGCPQHGGGGDVHPSALGHPICCRCGSRHQMAWYLWPRCCCPLSGSTPHRPRGGWQKGSQHSESNGARNRRKPKNIWFCNRALLIFKPTKTCVFFKQMCLLFLMVSWELPAKRHTWRQLWSSGSNACTM